MVDQKDVDATFNKVNVSDHSEGALKAYDKLKADYDSYSKSHNADDTKDYWKQVTQKLVDSKLINDLSVGWASENSAEFADSKGKYYKNDLRSIVTNNDPNNSITAVDATMASAMSKNIVDLTHMHEDLVGGFWGIAAEEDSGVTKDDINEYLNRNKKSADQFGSAAAMDPLFRNDAVLFKTLDTIGSQHADNKITQEDLNKYLSDYQKYTNNGASPQPDGQAFSKQNKDYVQALLANWDTPQGKLLRSSPDVVAPDWNTALPLFPSVHDYGPTQDNEISLDTLGRAAGLSGIDNYDIPLFVSKLQEKESSLGVDIAGSSKTANSTDNNSSQVGSSSGDTGTSGNGGASGNGSASSDNAPAATGTTSANTGKDAGTNSDGAAKM